MKRVNVGIIGFGTVGSGTFEVLTENREAIANRVGAGWLSRKSLTWTLNLTGAFV